MYDNEIGLSLSSHAIAISQSVTSRTFNRHKVDHIILLIFHVNMVRLSIAYNIALILKFYYSSFVPSKMPVTVS